MGRGQHLADPGRADRRHAGIHEPGAGRGRVPSRRPLQRRLQPGGLLLTDVLRAAVPRLQDNDSTSSQRGAEPPRRLNDRIARDLETICLKSLAKEPARRYPTALALAEDLRHWLAGQPIRARSVTRFKRADLCWRNRLVASLSAAVFLLLAVLTAGSLIKNAQLTTALAESQTANQQATVKLWESLHDRAWAMRIGRHVGQRLEALRSIAEALRLPLPPGHTLDELRTEAVAAFGCHIEVEREWPGGLTPGMVSVAFDDNLGKYARLAQDGTVTLRRVSDDEEIARWKEHTEGAWPYQDRNLLFSRDGRCLSIWHTGSKRLVVRRLDGPEPNSCYHAENVRSDVDFTPDGTKLAYSVTDGGIAVVDLPSGQVRYLPSAGAEPRAIRSLPMAAASQSRSIVTVNMSSGPCPGNGEGGKHSASSGPGISGLAPGRASAGDHLA